jgi:quercetin dioxygenase-like cupin family protein
VEHTKAEDIPWEAAPEEHFTGRVLFGPLSQVEGALNALAVHFEPGARTDWHTHPDGQVLYVVNGAGLVQRDDGTTVEFSAGDVVYASPGERHWHGAKPNSPMMHLSLTTGGATVWLRDKVSDDQYHSRP